MNKLILIACLATLAITISEAKFEKQSKIFRLPWIPLPPINRPPATTNPGTTNPAPPAASTCTMVEGCTACNSPADGKCDKGPTGTKGACYMDFCSIDPAGTYCERGCSV